jgi:lipoate-protein ligase A
VVVGFSGKIHELVHVDKAKMDAVPVIRRYTGGGTVIVDSSTAFVSFVMNASAADTKPYPREIMAWSAEIYEPVFNNKKKSDSNIFSLKENDYVFFDDKKIGGNAQTLTKDRWVHHTSFLWDFNPDNMGYLQMPAKRPEYRRGRPHTDFLCTIKENSKLTSLDEFADRVLESMSTQYEIKEVPYETIVNELINEIEQSTEKSVEELARSKAEPV